MLTADSDWPPTPIDPGIKNFRHYIFFGGPYILSSAPHIRNSSHAIHVVFPRSLAYINRQLDFLFLKSPLTGRLLQLTLGSKTSGIIYFSAAHIFFLPRLIYAILPTQFTWYFHGPLPTLTDSWTFCFWNPLPNRLVIGQYVTDGVI